jgi:UDP:flavonoid glycosyltransferase YjiC (YdhE family)
VVAVTLPELDPPEPGVLISGPAWLGSPRPAPPRVDPAVPASLSTLAQAGQTRVMQRILDALGALPVRDSDDGRGVGPAALRPPANSRVVPYAPHEKLLPQMSLVISHGGHSTAMAALARDLPLLLLPMFSLSDQPAVARALADRGAALTLPKEGGSREIRTAVETLLGDPAYRTAAAALGAAIRRRDGADVAADALVAAAPGSPAVPIGTVELGPAPVQPGRPRGGRPSLPNRIMEFEGRQVREE